MNIKNTYLCHDVSRFSFVLLLLVISGLSGCAHDASQSMPGTLNETIHATDHAASQTPDEQKSRIDPLAENLGIEIMSLRPTAMGRMLDLRYRVVDPKRAAELIKRNSKMEFHVVDVKTGHVLRVPMTHLGLLRARTFKPRENGIYYALFENPEGMLKSGSEVSIQIGSIKVDGWRVE